MKGARVANWHETVVTASDSNFDAALYLAVNADLRAAARNDPGFDPRAHFDRFGRQEKRKQLARRHVRLAGLGGLDRSYDLPDVGPSRGDGTPASGVLPEEHARIGVHAKALPDEQGGIARMGEAGVVRHEG